MGRVLLPNSVDVFRCAVAFLIRLVGDIKFAVLCKIGHNRTIQSSEPLDLTVLNCRVRLTKQKQDETILNAFAVEICGSIHATSDMHYTSLRILVTDVTDGIGKSKPVESQVRQCQIRDSSTFCYYVDLGKLPRADTTLSDWNTVAQLQPDWLRFPRKGKRKLQFTTSILSCQSGEELASATCIFTYENPSFGYIDLQENIQRTRSLAVALAFAVSAADKMLYDCEIELIKDWARNNIDFYRASKRARRRLDKALNRTVDFFCKGNELDTYKICKEIVEIAPLSERYDILDLCLHVTQANGVARVEELALLKNLANWLEVDMDRFRAMILKILPVSMHEVEDVETILGVTSNMDKDEARRHLNTEYRKWNARVTNSDTAVKSQADHMINFIAKARSQYVR